MELGWKLEPLNRCWSRTLPSTLLEIKSRWEVEVFREAEGNGCGAEAGESRAASDIYEEARKAEAFRFGLKR